MNVDLMPDEVQSVSYEEALAMEKSYSTQYSWIVKKEKKGQPKKIKYYSKNKIKNILILSNIFLIFKAKGKCMGNIYFRGIRLVFEEKEFNCTFVRKKY